MITVTIGNEQAKVYKEGGISYEIFVLGNNFGFVANDSPSEEIQDYATWLQVRMQRRNARKTVTAI